MNQSTNANQDGGDAFHVMLPGGELRLFSLDELDAAFNSGGVDARTFVLAPGTTEWARLGELLGLDEDGGESEGDEPPTTQASPQSESPAEDDDFAYVPQHRSDEVIDYVPQQATPVAAPVAQVAAAEAVPETITYVPLPRTAEVLDYIPQRPPVAAAPVGYIPQRPLMIAPVASTYPPAVAAVAQVMAAPAVSVSVIPPAPASFAPMPSVRPVALDLDFDLSPPPELRRRSRTPFVVAITVLALAGGGFAAFKQVNRQSEAAATAAAAAAAVAAAPPPAPLSATPTPMTQISMAAPFTSDKPRLTEEQKRALADADKAHAVKASAQHAARAEKAASHHHGSGKHSKEKVFHKGGATGDPLAL